MIVCAVISEAIAASAENVQSPSPLILLIMNLFLMLRKNSSCLAATPNAVESGAAVSSSSDKAGEID